MKRKILFVLAPLFLLLVGLVNAESGICEKTLDKAKLRALEKIIEDKGGDCTIQRIETGQLTYVRDLSPISSGISYDNLCWFDSKFVSIQSKTYNVCMGRIAGGFGSWSGEDINKLVSGEWHFCEVTAKTCNVTENFLRLSSSEKLNLWINTIFELFQSFLRGGV